MAASQMVVLRTRHNNNKTHANVHMIQKTVETGELKKNKITEMTMTPILNWLTSILKFPMARPSGGTL
jgi:hypothetical protein